MITREEFLLNASTKLLAAEIAIGTVWIPENGDVKWALDKAEALWLEYSKRYLESRIKKQVEARP